MLLCIIESGYEQDGLPILKRTQGKGGCDIPAHYILASCCNCKHGCRWHYCKEDDCKGEDLRAGTGVDRSKHPTYLGHLDKIARVENVLLVNGITSIKQLSDFGVVERLVRLCAPILVGAPAGDVQLTHLMVHRKSCKRTRVESDAPSSAAAGPSACPSAAGASAADGINSVSEGGIVSAAAAITKIIMRGRITEASVAAAVSMVLAPIVPVPLVSPALPRFEEVEDESLCSDKGKKHDDEAGSTAGAISALLSLQHQKFEVCS